MNPKPRFPPDRSDEWATGSVPVDMPIVGETYHGRRPNGCRPARRRQRLRLRMAARGTPPKVQTMREEPLATDS